MSDATGVIQQLETGLKAVGLRQKVIANNIANMLTPGYRRKDLRFEEVLRTAVERGRPVGPESLVDAIVAPNTNPINEHGSDVDLDQEVGEMVRNAALYKTYMRVLARTYRQMESAINTGT